MSVLKTYFQRKPKYACCNTFTFCPFGGKTQFWFTYKKIFFIKAVKIVRIISNPFKFDCNKDLEPLPLITRISWCFPFPIPLKSARPT